MTQDRWSFETARLSVLDWRAVAADLPRVVQTLLTERVTAPLPEAWQGPFTEARAESWIRDRDAEGITLLVQSRESAEAVGLLLLHESTSEDTEGRELRVGYLIAEGWWGQGFATELVQGLVEWAGAQSYASMVAGVARDNAPSRRVLEKCGFRQTRDEGGSELFYEVGLLGRASH